MVRTPWGNSDELRGRRLPPGRAGRGEGVRRNQRERIFGGMVAAVAQRGYEATRVADVLELSGVSRKAFYEHFASKQDCFLATVQALVDAGLAGVREHYEAEGPWEERVRAGLDGFIVLLRHQPAAARLCFVDVHAVGAPALDPVERAFTEFAAMVAAGLDQLPEYRGMPAEMPRAIVGGLRKVFHTRIYRDEEEALERVGPQLWSWGMSYRPPPEPLRTGRRARAGAGRRRAATDYEYPERLIRATAEAVAEKGYPATTVGDIVEHSSTSLSTFYSHFAGKEEAMLAALDSGAALLLAAVVPAFRRGEGWPQSVHGALTAMFAYAVEEPAFARLGAVEVYAAGERALAQRDQVMEGLEALLAPGYELAPETSPIAAEAIGGAIYSLIHDKILADGPERLPETAPLATYIALAPFLGAEEACAVANGDGLRRAGQQAEPAR
jgi:AcrR family transcriptional regulator